MNSTNPRLLRSDRSGWQGRGRQRSRHSWPVVGGAAARAAWLRLYDLGRGVLSGLRRTTMEGTGNQEGSVTIGRTWRSSCVGLGFESRRRLQGQPQARPPTWGFSLSLTLRFGQIGHLWSVRLCDENPALESPAVGVLSAQLMAGTPEVEQARAVVITERRQLHDHPGSCLPCIQGVPALPHHAYCQALLYRRRNRLRIKVKPQP
jgi:hypothetical protein